MSWPERVRFDENFNIIIESPPRFTFGANRHPDPTKKAKKKQSRQILYINDEEMNIRHKLTHQRRKQANIYKSTEAPVPAPQEPYILNLSDGDNIWPPLQRRVTPPPPKTFNFKDYKAPQRPGWYTLLLPKFAYLSHVGTSLVPHSTYLNIRLYELQKIRNTSIINKGSEKNIYGLWLLAQTLKVLIPMLRVRRLIRRFIQLWHLNRCNQRAERMDPFTLCEAINPISIYCMKVHKRYDFDGYNIIKHISSCLRYQNSAFPIAAMPKLPQTNEALTYYQLISIFDQSKRKGIWSSIFSNFRAANFDLFRFSCLYSQDLQQRAITAENQSSDSFVVRDNIVYYFGKACDNHKIYPSIIDYKLMEYAVANNITHPYIQSWKNVITSYLSEFNIYHNSSERKNQIIANFNRRAAILLRLFCQFKKQIIPKFLAEQEEVEENEDIFGEEDNEDNEDQDE